MWLIVRGIANVAGSLLLLILVEFYCFSWSLFFLIEGLQGRAYGDHDPWQIVIAGLLCLCLSAMVFIFAVFLAARGWHLVHRRWASVPGVSLNAEAMQAIMRTSWIPAIAGIVLIVLPYFFIWGWPSHADIFSALVLVTWMIIPGAIAHEFLHAAGWWITGRVPSHQIRFAVAVRQVAAFAYTHHDIRIWAFQVSALLPVVLLAALPAAGGVLLHEPALVIFGFLMLVGSWGDLVLASLTFKYPARTLFNSCAESDERLQLFAHVNDLTMDQAAS